MCLKIECGCGSNQEIHQLGNEMCFRELVPSNEYPIKVNNGWSVLGINGNRHTITDYTLRFQRGYGFDENTKQWHRPKERGDDWFESKAWN